MQREETNSIVISCDFCGTDWDQVLPMIEGHRGSILCLACLKIAIDEIKVHQNTFCCALCIRENLPENLPRWRPDPYPERANQKALLCEDCLRQAVEKFHRDPDVDWGKPP